MDKIRRIFPLLILFTLLSCADTIETRIPYRIVSLELDLTYQDKALNAIQAYKIYTQANIDQDREQTGFGGVLVYHDCPVTEPVHSLRSMPLVLMRHPLMSS